MRRVYPQWGWVGGWAPNFLEVVLLCKSNNKIGIYRACTEAGTEVSPRRKGLRELVRYYI